MTREQMKEAADKSWGFEAVKHPRCCPHCGWQFDARESRLVPSHKWLDARNFAEGDLCPGIGQVPRNPESDKRPLWKDETNKMFQTVTLVLDDGRRVSYTGRAQIDGDKPLRILEVTFSPAKPLPEGMTWDIMPEPTEGKDKSR